MTPEILKQVEAVKHNPHAAEALCGRANVEFHPLACDVVRDAAEEGARCTHVPYGVRIAREAAYAKLTGTEPPKSVAPSKPKFAAAAAAPGVESPYDLPAPVEVVAPAGSVAVDEPAAVVVDDPEVEIAAAKPAAKAAKKK